MARNFSGVTLVIPIDRIFAPFNHRSKGIERDSFYSVQTGSADRRQPCFQETGFFTGAGDSSH